MKQTSIAALSSDRLDHFWVTTFPADEEILALGANVASTTGEVLVGQL